MSDYILIEAPFKVEKPEMLIAWLGLTDADIESYQVNPDDQCQVMVKIAAGKHPEYIRNVPLLLIEEVDDQPEGTTAPNQAAS
jgi:hypothetical protein